MLVPRFVRRVLRTGLHRAGYRLSRIDLRAEAASYDASRELPPNAAAALRHDHPRLVDLRRRYASLTLPMATATMWHPGYLENELSLAYFRGDNPYVWQYRNVGTSAHDKYYFYLRDLAARDSHGLLGKLGEDGLFGCWSFSYPGWPLVSRDLLDSINEIYFLERHLQVLGRSGLTVLDIGAGYGRLAHRLLNATPKIERYLCVDAIPESTFLCDYYLGFRDCLDRAEVVPLDELDTRLSGSRPDLAVNIHSFSEMSARSIDGWMEQVARLDTPWLLVIPNDADRLLTMEDDGTRRTFNDVIARWGYTLSVKEPVFLDPTFRRFMGVNDHFFLFSRGTGRT